MRLNYKPAFGLMEVILATSILTLVTASSTYLVQNARQLSLGSTDRNQAHSLALEGVEHVRALRDQNWADNVQTWVGNDPNADIGGDATTIFHLDPNISAVYCFNDISKSWVKGGVDTCSSSKNFQIDTTDIIHSVTTPPPPIMPDANGYVEGIDVVLPGGAKMLFYRYTFIQPFNPSMLLPTYPEEQKPPCQKTPDPDNPCSYLNMALENPANLQAPLDLSYTALTGHTPMALMVRVIVTWDGGNSKDKLEEAYSVITDWKPREQS